MAPAVVDQTLLMTTTMTTTTTTTTMMLMVMRLIVEFVQFLLSPMYIALSIVAIASRCCCRREGSGCRGRSISSGSGGNSCIARGSSGIGRRLEQRNRDDDVEEKDKGRGSSSSSRSSSSSCSITLLPWLSDLLKTMSSHGKTATAQTTATRPPTGRKSSNATENSFSSTTATTTTSSSSSYFITMWVPKSWFQHFYVFGLFSVLLLWTMTIVVSSWTWTGQSSSSSSSSSSPPPPLPLPPSTSSLSYVRSIVPILLLVVHLTRRTYECHRTYHRREKQQQQQQQPQPQPQQHGQQQQGQQQCHHQNQRSRMHVAGYVLGMLHYFVLPFCFLPTPSDFNIVDRDGSGDGHGHGHGDAGEEYAATRHSSLLLGVMELSVVAGTNLWLQYEQYHHHMILAELRQGVSHHPPQQQQQQPKRNHAAKDPIDNSNTTAVAPPPSQSGDDESNSCYKIPPRIRWFKYVWCPHYLAEILLYLTFATMIELSYYSQQHHQERQPNQIDNQECQWDETAGNNYTLCCQSQSIAVQLLYLLGFGRRFRHWMLLVWVFTNLTVAALNNADWYHKKLLQLELEEKHDDDDDEEEEKEISIDRRWAIIPFVV